MAEKISPEWYKSFWVLYRDFCSNAFELEIASKPDMLNHPVNYLIFNIVIKTLLISQVEPLKPGWHWQLKVLLSPLIQVPCCPHGCEEHAFVSIRKQHSLKDKKLIWILQSTLKVMASFFSNIVIWLGLSHIAISIQLSTKMHKICPNSALPIAWHDLMNPMLCFS